VEPVSALHRIPQWELLQHNPFNYGRLIRLDFPPQQSGNANAEHTRSAQFIFAPAGQRRACLSGSAGIGRRCFWETMMTSKTKRAGAAGASQKPAGAAAKQPRAITKGEQVLALLRRAKGATIADLTKATGWQPHSVRGFISGAIKKRQGLTVASSKDGDDARRYRVTGGGG
jgi:hypothetical protein